MRQWVTPTLNGRIEGLYVMHLWKSCIIKICSRLHINKSNENHYPSNESEIIGFLE